MIKVLENGGLDLTLLEITDVIDLKVLQTFQDNFALGMNIASVTVDRNGSPVTEPSSYTKFCIDFTHSTKTGDDRCAASHKKAGEEAARTGRPYIFTCHAGLTDFAAPIIVDGELLGTILGGQILTERPADDNFRKVAREIGVDVEGYVAASKEVYMSQEHNVKAAAEVLFIVANALSKNGYEQISLGKMAHVLSDNIGQISSAMEQLSASSIEVTDNQHHLSEEIQNIKNITVEINSILDSIKDIADETKMLGLNAAIEAARAGEAGRGFGVVATEIRALSQDSKATAIKIAEMTRIIQESVDRTIDTSKATLLTTEQTSAAVQETTSNLIEVSNLADKLNKIAACK
ncbi:MAG TPA: PocR ligand-binding domain-containing protein [Clostridia bacterium]|nr:PocR ligand-binding domain-containing protein [Clostridia bacterium]